MGKSRKLGVIAISLVATLSFGVVGSSPPAAVADDDAYTPSITNLVTANEAFAKIDKVNVMGESFGMHFLSVVNVGNTLYGYYIKNLPGSKFGTALATSTDGVSWTDQGVVLSPGASGSWDDRIASFPGVWYENGQFTLVYEGANVSGTEPGAIGLATSTDGINFTKHNGSGGPILSRNSTGFESANIGTPSLWREGGTWYLYYHGFDGTDLDLGVATGSTLTSLTKYSGNPILSTSASGWDSGTIGKRSIVKEGSAYFMVYEGSTDAVAGDFGNSQWSSGLARATSLFGPWVKYDQNPLLAPAATNPFGSNFGNDGPEWVTIGSERWIYFRSVSSVGNVTRRAMLANETNGGWGLMWETESQFHQIGRADADGWSVNTTDGSGFSAYGPYTTSIPVDYNTGIVKLRIDNNTANNDVVARIDVYNATTNVVLAVRDITRQQFKLANHDEFFIVPFQLPPSAGNDQIEIRTYVFGATYLRQDRQGTD